MSKIFQYPFQPVREKAQPRDQTGVNRLGIYTSEATQRFVHGTRYLTWDGRVFKYALTGGEVESYHGAHASEDAAQAWEVAGAASSIGDIDITATISSRSEDDFAGGYAVLYDATDIDITCQRGIVGNDKTSGTTTKIYLDYPLHQAIISGTDAIELYENPYGAVKETDDSYVAWVGVPCVSCATALNIWIQTWGPCLVSGGETIDTPSADTRTLRWGSNAALFTESTKAEAQIAGYILNRGSSSIAGPIIMLMCST